MISFKQFLSEQKEFDLDTFISDCEPFLSEIKGSHGQRLLYHGTKQPPTDFEIKTWRERSGPRDTDKPTHDRVNAFMTKTFGEAVRNWMYVTGSKDQAFIYAKSGNGITVIFPIGKFEWLCNLDDDGRDMSSWHLQIAMQIADSTKGTLTGEEEDKLATDYMLKKMQHSKWAHNDKLLACIYSDNEIMLKCDKFYMFSINGNAWQQVKKYLEK